MNASSFFIPRNFAVDIVIALLDIPGSIANICAIPIAREFFDERFENTFVSFVKSKIAPVKINAAPMNKYDEDKDTTRSLNKSPNIATGIVAIIMYFHIFCACLSNFISFFISLLVNINTANSDAICKTVKKKRFGCEIKFETSDRCPSEDIGRNSVIACTIASIISFSIFYLLRQCLNNLRFLC